MVRARIETRSLLRTDPNDQKHARKVNYRFTSWQNDLLSIPFAVASAQTPKRVCAVYYLFKIIILTDLLSIRYIYVALAAGPRYPIFKEI